MQVTQLLQVFGHGSNLPILKLVDLLFSVSKYLLTGVICPGNIVGLLLM